MSTDLPTGYRIAEVDDSADAVLRNLLEHYSHDMAEWFHFESHEDGAYHFQTEKVWQDGFRVHLLYSRKIPVGFAIVGSADAYLGRPGARDVDEFFVVRRHRRRGLGQAFATHVWDTYAGQWLVRVLQANLPASPFWRGAISTYTGGQFDEGVRTVGGRPWSWFTFETPPSPTG